MKKTLILLGLLLLATGSTTFAKNSDTNASVLQKPEIQAPTAKQEIIKNNENKKPDKNYKNLNQQRKPNQNFKADRKFQNQQRVYNNHRPDKQARIGNYASHDKFTPKKYNRQQYRNMNRRQPNHKGKYAGRRPSRRISR